MVGVIILAVGLLGYGLGATITRWRDLREFERFAKEVHDEFQRCAEGFDLQ
jgi:hypothetical protein